MKNQLKNSVLKNLFISILCFTAVFNTTVCSALETWVPVKDVSLMVEPGSILDFSSLISPPKPIDTRIIINSQGHFSLENHPEKSQRFLVGSLGFGSSLGGFPSHDLTDLYIKQYRLHGYNMTRLDFVEATLMEGRQKDFDFSPEQLDQFYYLLAQLRSNGIYYLLNGLSNDNGGYGDVTERWIGNKGMISGVYFDADKQAHWKKLIERIYGSTNPYTGVTTLKDPAFAGMILVNEGNLVFVNRNGVKPELKPYFSKWLKTKYGSNKALKAAWGNELQANENIEINQINFPKPDAWTSHRMSDLQAFFFDTEKKTADWMTQYLRTLGFKGQVTSYNLWHSPAAQATRGQFKWVDMHNYFGHPEYIGSQMKVRQDSMLQNGASYVRELASAKHLGKAFTVTEHGQVFWNQYRRENGLAIPAYAALQSWDAICQHSGALDLSYAPTVGRKNIINPFAVGTDPISRATETLAALLYLRGDVAPALSTISVKLTPQDAFDKSAHLGNTPADVSKLSLVTGIGLDWQPKGTPTIKLLNFDAEVEFNEPGISSNKNGVIKEVKSTQNLGLKLDNLAKQYAGGLAYKFSRVKMIADDRWSARVQNLRDAQLINTDNLTNAEQGIYQSDTGEVVLESEHKRMTVITAKTEAVVFDKPSTIILRQLSVLSADAAALVAVSAMDNLPLATSKRMLVVLSTDARNTNMRFSDIEQTTLLDLGRSPVLIRSTKVKLALRNTNRNLLKVFSTNLRGQRQDAINVKQTDTSIEFELDIGKLTHGATTYFEISI